MSLSDMYLRSCIPFAKNCIRVVKVATTVSTSIRNWGYCWRTFPSHLAPVVTEVQMFDSWLELWCPSCCKEVLSILTRNYVYGWSDNSIVSSWMAGGPRCLKTYVRNHITAVAEQVLPDRWNNTKEVENLVDCTKRGVFPAELLKHNF